MSQSFSSDQSKFFFEQELERTVHALSHWMIINNYSKASVRIIKNIFSKALRSLVAPTDLEPSALLRNISFLSAVKDESDREVYTQRLFNVLLLMGEDSLEMGLENEIFSFTEINPGIGAFGLASINLGGFPHGARLVSSIASPAFRENRGSDSDLEPYLPVHLTLVNLPFSVFVGTGNADPSVVKIVEEAASNRANTKCTIFRVD